MTHAAATERHDLAQARDVSTVDKMLAGHDDSIERVHHMIGRLEERLEKVLGPHRPEAVSGDAVRDDDPPRSPLANKIATMTGGTNHAGDRLGSLLDRLEV